MKCFLLYCVKDVAKYEDSENRFVVKEIIKEIGEPRNYGLTDEEKESLERKAAEECLAREAKEKAERERREAEERAERIANWEEWVSQYVFLGKTSLFVCFRE